MPRRTPPDRLEQLVDVATGVFVRQGYRRTQMADVAEALGVAKGTLYLAVEGKEALFDLVLRLADAPRPFVDPPELPVRTPPPGATLAMLRERIASEGQLPSLAAAMAVRRVGDVRAELDGILRELYDVLARHRTAITLVDVCARDYPELAGLWFTAARGGALATLESYLSDRIRRRRLRPVPDVAAAARQVIEILVFWAVHRHWDPQPTSVDDTVARETALHFVMGALAPEERA